MHAIPHSRGIAGCCFFSFLCCRLLRHSFVVKCKGSTRDPHTRERVGGAVCYECGSWWGSTWKIKYANFFRKIEFSTLAWFFLRNAKKDLLTRFASLFPFHSPHPIWRFHFIYQVHSFCVVCVAISRFSFPNASKLLGVLLPLLCSNFIAVHSPFVHAFCSCPPSPCLLVYSSVFRVSIFHVSKWIYFLYSMCTHFVPFFSLLYINVVILFFFILGRVQ